MEITLLKTQHGDVVAAYVLRTDVEAKRDAYNADPEFEPGTPDSDAPYYVETWCVRAASEQA